MQKNIKNEAKNELCHFAASNSGEGFKSYYGEVFGHADIIRRYLIKGGPGTGKSTLMRRVADALSADGSCVEYYYCSSDVSSLDGIVINGKIALVDATAPHAAEPELAGARDEIINLGELWSSEGLYAETAEIKALSAKKSECYRQAYRFLLGAESVNVTAREIGEKHTDKEKMRRAVARIMRRYKSDGEYKYSVGICNSVGMTGRTHLDTYETLANTVYLVDDSLGTGSLLLSAVVDEAMRRGMHIRVSFDPVSPAYPDAIMLTGSKTSFVLCNPSDGEGSASNYHETMQKNIYKINMKRFFKPVGSKAEQKRDKSTVRCCRRLCEGLVQSALDSLERAGEYHFALESLYKKEMNFAKMREITENLTAEMRKFLP